MTKNASFSNFTSPVRGGAKSTVRVPQGGNGLVRGLFFCIDQLEAANILWTVKVIGLRRVALLNDEKNSLLDLKVRIIGATAAETNKRMKRTSTRLPKTSCYR
jgi:hypothetical protein